MFWHTCQVTHTALPGDNQRVGLQKVNSLQGEGRDAQDLCPKEGACLQEEYMQLQYVTPSPLPILHSRQFSREACQKGHGKWLAILLNSSRDRQRWKSVQEQNGRQSWLTWKSCLKYIGKLTRKERKQCPTGKKGGRSPEIRS